MGWINLAQFRDQWKALLNTVMNYEVPLHVWKFLSSCTTGDFPRKAQFHEVSQLWEQQLQFNFQSDMTTKYGFR
jgi:hypothetical protein